jgi:hypothetical protein
MGHLSRFYLAIVCPALAALAQNTGMRSAINGNIRAGLAVPARACPAEANRTVKNASKLVSTFSEACYLKRTPRRVQSPAPPRLLHPRQFGPRSENPGWRCAPAVMVALQSDALTAAGVMGVQISSSPTLPGGSSSVSSPPCEPRATACAGRPRFPNSNPPRRRRAWAQPRTRR